MTEVIDLSEGPYDFPRKYEVITEDGYYGRPKGETLVYDESHPLIQRGLESGALRLLDEPASEDDNGDG